MRDKDHRRNNGCQDPGNRLAFQPPEELTGYGGNVNGQEKIREPEFDVGQLSH